MVGTQIDAGPVMTDPAMAVLRGAGLPAVAASVLTAAGFTLAVGAGEGASVLLGGGMAGVALAVAPLVQRLTRRMDPALVLGIAVLAYSVVMLMVGLVYTGVSGLAWVSSTPAGLGALAAILGWSAGHIWTSQRMRELLYDTD